jgi:WD40 repeat protein
MKIVYQTGQAPVRLILTHHASRIASALCAAACALASSLQADDKPVSFYKDVVPVFKRSCNGCHHPGKLKGELDLTTYAAFKKGGKHGAPFKPGDAKESIIIEEISGKEPSMPKEGDPLTAQEVALIESWIKQGASDDTPADANSFKIAGPPTYTTAPVISALAFSPDGKVLAVSGYHEVLLQSPTGSNIIARLVGESPRIESLTYSADGKMLGVAGSAPARFGEIQIWDTASNTLLKSFKASIDSVYGLSFSPNGDRVVFGCADKSVRVLAVKDGKELLKFDNHSDWVFGATFTVNGKRLLSGSRDRAMKLIDASNGQFIDDINKLLEPVLCISRHPKEDIVAYGGDMGTTRIYKIAENQGRTAANNDVNLVKEIERLPGPVHAISYSPDGNSLAVGGVNGELRLFNSKDGKRLATLKGHEAAVFAVAFHPTTNWLASGGFDGKVRIHETTKGALVTEFVPVPIKVETVMQKASAK